MRWKGLSNFLDEFNKELRVSICYIQANEIDTFDVVQYFT